MLFPLIFLAETEVSNKEVGAFVGCLVIIVVLAVALKELMTRKPALHVEFVSQVDHSKLEERVDGIENKIQQGYERLDQKRSVSIAGVHELVRKQGEAIAALTAETGSQTRQLHQIQSVVERMPEKIIAMQGRLK